VAAGDIIQSGTARRIWYSSDGSPLVRAEPVFHISAGRHDIFIQGRKEYEKPDVQM